LSNFFLFFLFNNTIIAEVGFGKQSYVLSDFQFFTSQTDIKVFFFFEDYVLRVLWLRLFVRLMIYSLWTIVFIVRGVYHRIVLRDNDGELSQYSELSPCKFVEEMAIVVIVFFLPLHVLDRNLKLALDFIEEQIVDENIVILLIQFVFNPDEFEFPF
jgi:hypothetical protein